LLTKPTEENAMSEQERQDRQDRQASLKRLQAEIERQDRELAACFEELRGLDPELQVAVSPEWMQAMRDAASTSTPEPLPVHAWSQRA
jgi:hypothetical protein